MGCIYSYIKMKDTKQNIQLNANGCINKLEQQQKNKQSLVNKYFMQYIVKYHNNEMLLNKTAAV